MPISEFYCFINITEITMKLTFTKFLFGFTIAAAWLISSNINADIAVNFNNDFGTGASLSDFTAADPNLDPATPFFSTDGGTGQGGATGANGARATLFNNFTATGLTGLNFSTTSSGTVNGGFGAFQPANNVNPILSSNIFVGGGGTAGITVTGLSALNAGDSFTIVGYGIGDNINQDVTFDATFGSTIQSAATAFNDGTSRIATAGSAPFQSFTFAADGITDTLTLVATGNGSDADGLGPQRAHLNGFSFSVTEVASVPEPTGLVFVSGLMLVGTLRRKRS